MLEHSVLRAGLARLFSAQTMPVGLASEAAERWLDAYIAYAVSATAGVMSPLFTETGAGLSRMFSTDGFLIQLPQAIERLWFTSTWAAPGLTGKVTTVGLLSLSTPLEFKDESSGLDFFSTKLHEYASSLVVTGVTSTGMSSFFSVT